MLLFLVGKEKHGHIFRRPVLSSSFFEECLSHPLLLFFGRTAGLEQQVIHCSASEHMDQIQLLPLRSECRFTDLK